MRHHSRNDYGLVAVGELRLMLKHYLMLSGWVVLSELTSSITLSNIHTASITIVETNVSAPVVKCSTVGGRDFTYTWELSRLSMTAGNEDWDLFHDEEKFYLISPQGLFFFGPISTKNGNLKKAHMLTSFLVGHVSQINLFSVGSSPWSCILDTWAEGVPWTTTCQLYESGDYESRNANNTKNGILDVYPVNIRQANGKFCGSLKGVWQIGDNALPQRTPILLSSGNFLYPLMYDYSNRLLGYEIDG